MHDGTLIIGHGTRNEPGRDEFRAVVAARAAQTAEPVELAFLELAEPSIPDALKRLVDRGARRITVIPLLLFAAGHAKRDIPTAIERFLQLHPGVSIDCRNVLNCHPRLLELSQLRVTEALADRPAVEPRQTMLVMIGRGSLDHDASAELHRFAELRQRQSGVGGLQVGFLAMARPTLAEALEAAARSEFRRIVVQPHLLFRGQLLDEVRDAVGQIESRQRAQSWVVVPHLGPHPLLVECLRAEP